MDDFLTKPVDTGRLESLLRTHVADRTDAPLADESAPDGSPPLAAEVAPDVVPEVAVEVAPALVASRLEELDSLGERAMLLVDRAVDNFVRGFPETLSELHDALAAGHTDEVRTTAHRLRGSALNLGAARVAEVGLMIELWEESSPLGVPELLEQLEQAGADAAAALREYQAVRGDAQAAAS
jgi:HPt (histidine-containing phosphotransfer) domain-containing protein